MPCVLAFDQRMVEYWCRVEQPRVVVVEIGPSWTLQVTDTMIRRGLAVVALSDDEEERIAALGRGFQDAIATTHAPRELAARLRQRFLQLSNAPANVVVVEGPLRLDLATRQVWWWNEERHLGPMQFYLLAHLAARSNTMVPIETLLREYLARGLGWSRVPQQGHQDDWPYPRGSWGRFDRLFEIISRPLQLYDSIGPSLLWISSGGGKILG